MEFGKFYKLIDSQTEPIESHKSSKYNLIFKNKINEFFPMLCQS